MLSFVINNNVAKESIVVAPYSSIQDGERQCDAVPSTYKAPKVLILAEILEVKGPADSRVFAAHPLYQSTRCLPSKVLIDYRPE